jgi:hypothetical protein
MAAALPVGRLSRCVWLLAAYIVPAVTAWILLGLLVSVLPLRAAALTLIVVYGLFYGPLEVAGRARPAPPGSRWQVPSGWVLSVSRWRKTVIWGSMLGPGFATRNPYAGFWLLPLAVAAVGDLRSGVLLAAAIGVAHAAGRALALMRSVRMVNETDYLQSVLTRMYWRAFDGYALLAVAGVSVMEWVYRL